ncbi:MAG: Uma2 family endonuclease [Methylococcaceae bacterium]|nr:MAG: Uma2 family endonuclease [Methylococcaceae bacterium]
MARTTELAQLDLNGIYTYADYLTWQFDDAVELIKGKIMTMSPAPSSEHQGISWRLSGLLFNYLKNKPCRAYAAPFDVRLYDRKKSIVANQEIYSVVQPDLSVICDAAKIDKKGCLGAPDWIIEILSAGNSKKDMQIKYRLYQESGVQEYWLIYPYEKAVHQFVFDEEAGKYPLLNMYAGDDIAVPQLFPDCRIDLREVFESEGE